MRTPKPRVLIVDDTVSFRMLLSKIIDTIPGMELVTTAQDGPDALKKLAGGGIDLVLLDMVMPQMSGLETLRCMMADYPDVMTVVVSGQVGRDAEDVICALEMGALEFVPKPSVEDAEDATAKLRRSIEYVGRIAARRMQKRSASTGIAAYASSLKPTQVGPFQVVVIGVSTGGPNALQEIIPRLPADLPCPVLMVQHMPPRFTQSLAERLDAVSELRVREARDGESAVAGDVLVAPGGLHMTVERDNSDEPFQIQLVDGPMLHSCRPAVDRLFVSIAEHTDSPVLAVILTGMGSDGADGVEALKKKTCYCLTQDEQTSVVFGMPGAVVERGLADEVLPLEEVAGRIVQLVTGRADR